MNSKYPATVTAILALASAFAVVGCAGDDCTRATDHMAQCATAPAASGSSNPPSATLACSGAFLCKSQCANEHTCEQIIGQAPQYIQCLTACQPK